MHSFAIYSFTAIRCGERLSRIYDGIGDGARQPMELLELFESSSFKFLIGIQTGTIHVNSTTVRPRTRMNLERSGHSGYTVAG